MEGVKIIEMREEVRSDDFGRSKATIMVGFMVDGRHGPFFERFDKADFTQLAFEQRVQPFLFNLRGLTGQTPR